MRGFFLLIMLFLGPSFALAGPDLPAMMLLTGEISPAASLKGTRAEDGDRVLAFSVADSQLVGAGAVSGGSYALAMNRTVSFNGSPVVLELQQGRRRFALLHAADNAPAVLPFVGRTLPERQRLLLRVGVQTAELSADEASEPQAQRLSLRADLPCSPEADVNRDGVCDEADFRLLRLYGGGVTRTVGRP